MVLSGVEWFGCLGWVSGDDNGDVVRMLRLVAVLVVVGGVGNSGEDVMVLRLLVLGGGDVDVRVLKMVAVLVVVGGGGGGGDDVRVLKLIAVLGVGVDVGGGDVRVLRLIAVRVGVDVDDSGDDVWMLKLVVLMVVLIGGDTLVVVIC